MPLVQISLNRKSAMCLRKEMENGFKIVEDNTIFDSN